METINYILFGFTIALKPINIFYAFLGAVGGTLVGVLPGLGPLAAMSLLLPVTFGMDPTGAIIMLGGIYYGAQYGGSTTSILVNIPGEAASVITCLDGYQMAMKGRAGLALGLSAIGSFIAGTIGVLGLSFVAPPLVKFALSFGPPEYFSLTVLGLTVLSFMARGSMIKSIMMAVLGLFIGTVGMDTVTGIQRFTFGQQDLMEGIHMVIIAMGMFGVAEIFDNLAKTIKVEVFFTKITGYFPRGGEWKRSIMAILRGTGLGFFLGILPGGGAVIGSFASYATEKKISDHPEEFGNGAIEGVAGPEAANNAGAQGAFIPMMTLGLPSNVVMGLLLGALMIHGIPPGPMLMVQHKDLFWGFICSMYIGNVMCLVLNLPLIPIWVKFLKIPYPILCPFILLFCLIGVYSINNSVFDVYLMMAFGVIGYIFRKLEFEPAPLILAVIIGPMMEKALRQSLAMSKGDIMIFLQRPISLALLVVAILTLILPLMPKLINREKITELVK